jgi:DNA repair exonuclease SbcCD ATPase subunit
MLIKTVEVENFFCYVDINEFEFKAGLNIISAKNSGGKSHLFNAFHWTFFNSIYIDIEAGSSQKTWRNANNINLLPDFKIHNAIDGDIINTRVKIILSNNFHENNNQEEEIIDYHFEKYVKFQKGQGNIIQITNPELNIWYVRDGETIYLEKGEHNWFLNSIFPESIRKFMWFQGETVDELYDFSKPSTLNYAIKEISYYPLYENIVDITNKSVYSISNKVNKELQKSKRFTKEQEEINAKYEQSQRSLDRITNQILELENQLIEISDAIINEELKLKGFDKYTELKTKSTKLEYDIKHINDQIEHLTNYGKEKFISKWMLNKCDQLIQKSKSNITLLSDELKAYQKTENPVPLTLPGPEYIQKMLEDHICYICERHVEDGSEAHIALTTRLEDFKLNQVHKIISDNYTELNRNYRNILIELPNITEEVITNEEQIENLLQKRRELLKNKELLYEQFNISEDSEIRVGHNTAEQIVNKLRSLNSDKNALEKRLTIREKDKIIEIETIMAATRIIMFV